MKYLTKFCSLLSGRLLSAYTILKENIDKAANSYNGRNRTDWMQLIELYQKNGQIEEYKNELMAFISFGWWTDFSYLLRLKDVMEKDEWVIYRDRLLADNGIKIDRYRLMHEEGLYRQLLDEILAKRDIHSLDQYENVLKERYPEGAKIAEEIAREWRAVYARRPAMMDELRKGGF